MNKFLIIAALLLTPACGPKGDVGLQGKPGLPGEAGTPAEISAEPFCPSLPGVIGYANIESYLIIDSNVYAVYADKKHTFLTLLTPGTYHTTDGRDCTFTVGTDGSVL